MAYSSTVYLYVLNDPIIESSANITFAPYNVAYPKLDEHVRSVGFDPQVNKWDLIFDFTTSEKKLNYQLMDPADFTLVTKEVEGMDEQPVRVFPYPQKYGGTVADDANKHEVKDEHMMAFSIGVSAKDAAKLVQAKEEELEKQAPIIEEVPYQEQQYQQEV
jgi:Tubulin binding cofactor C